MTYRSSLILAAALLGACSSAPQPGGPAPETTTEGRRTGAAPMPPIPSVDGPLRLDVAYPAEGASIAVRDSNFIFGSTGSGQASLTVNGAPVEVKPNGAWLAYLPVPPDGVYRLSAVRGTDTASFTRTVKVPAAPGTRPSGAYITRGSVTPSGALAVKSGDNVEVSFTGARGGQAWLLLPGGARFPLVERAAAIQAANNAADFQTTPQPTTQSSQSRYAGIFPARALRTADTSVARPQIGTVADVLPTDTAARVMLIVGKDSVTAPLSLNLNTIDVPRVAVAVDRTQGGPVKEWRIRGRNAPSGPFHYFWPHGTVMTITGQRGGFYKVQLAGDLTAWVPVSDVQLLPIGTPPPGGAVGVARFIPSADYIDLRVGVPDRLPYHIEETENGIQLNVFGATSQVNFFQYGSYDPLIERAVWSQPRDSVFRVNVTLTKPVWGYDAFHEGNSVVLRIRRPPVIDEHHPFRGLTIALDAGHGGRDTATIGPTRFPEAHANLAIALKLQPLLEAAGAHVVMIRSSNVFVDLGERTKIATDSNAHVLLSIHNNAFPDGVNPFTNNGTSTYYYHPQSVDLAQLLLRELIGELGLRDIGYGRADLALVRPTWMPAALTETSFLMIPEQEAGLRNPEWQERIARAHFRALEDFLRKRAAAQ